MSSLQHKASYLTVQCKECRATNVVPCKPGLGGALLPRRCETMDPITQQRCPQNSWVVLGERSRYVDQQTLKLQVHGLVFSGGRGEGRGGTKVYTGQQTGMGLLRVTGCSSCN